MKKTANRRINRQSGQVVMAAVLVFMSLSLVVVIGISAPIAAQIRNTSIALETRKAVSTAEVLTDDALYRLYSGRTLPSTVTLSLNQSTSTALITDVGTSKQIITTSASKNTTRTTKALFNAGGSAAPISYALQTGQGGFQITGGARVNGNIYSNGSVVGYGGGNVVGSVTAAASLVETVITDNDDSAGVYGGVDVGKLNSVQQLGQSFTVSTSTPITTFSLYIKKTGAPGNGTLRIYNSSGGTVGSTQIGSTGTLSAASVTTSYAWVDVYPYAPITLTPGTTYWMTLEVIGSSVGNYYTLGTNNNVYSAGALKTRTRTGTTWGSYVDIATSTQDLLFTTAVGGVTYITGNGWDKFSITGNANAGTINSTQVSGSLYCQNGDMNAQACNTTQPIPTAVDLPIQADRIATWKAQASAGTVRNSSWTINGGVSTSTPGPMRINGDLTVTGGASLTLNGPLYVTGTIYVNGGTEIKLAPSYGANDEYVVAPYVRLSGGGLIKGSGTAGSYVIVAADGADCSPACGGSTYAATTDGGTASMVFVVPNGTLRITGGVNLKAAMAKTIIMDGGSVLTYESALSNITFSNSGSTAWSVESWREI